MRKVLLTIGALALGGCASTRNATPFQMADTYIKAPYDAVWQSAVAYFADARVPIATIDKQSGLIASRQVSLSKDQMIRWLDCGSYGDRPMVNKLADDWKLSAVVDFNVFMRPLTDSTSARVNLTVSAQSQQVFSMAMGKAQCESSGAFEKALVAHLAESARVGSKR